MSKISWRQVSALALAAFFVVGSLTNIFTPGSIYEEYLRWGYPHWFHFVTGSLELTTAVLLAQARTRLWGCTVMLAALATVTLHGEYGHGVPPLIVATLSIVVGWIAWRKRLPQPGMTDATGGSRECPRAGWAEAFEQFGIPKGHTGAAEEMFESVNAGWMDLGITGTEHVAGTTSAREVFAAAQNAVKA